MLAALLFLPAVGWSASCGEECTQASDCTHPACPVCIGVCVSCYALGDSFACSDPTTGASTACFWLGGTGDCTDIAAVPEVPKESRAWLLLGIALSTYWIGTRSKRKNRPAH